MKLSYLRLHNFRQYIGDHQIDFAKGEDKKNVTLIRGANGYGKTAIFRAIMFCLYGLKHLDQDNLSPTQARQGLILVNEKLLNEVPGERVLSSVELDFTHQGSAYTIRREISAIKRRDDEIVQEDGLVSLQETVASGDTKAPITDYKEIADKVNQILPEQLRDFFLFDGERMEKLTKPGDEQRKEIKRGIRSLLQLDTLENAINGLKQQERKLTAQIKVNSGSELEIVTEQKLKLDEAIEAHERQYKDAEANIVEIEKNIEKIDTQLSENKASVDLQNSRKQIKDEKLKKEGLLDEYTKELRGAISSYAPVIGLPALSELYEELNARLERGELPSDVKEEFIEGILNNALCICGTHLKEGSPERHRIEEYQKKKVISGHDELMKLWGNLKAVVVKAENLDIQFEDTFQKIQSSREDIQALDRQLLRLEDELKESGNIDVQNLTSQLQTFRRDRDTFIQKVGELKSKIAEEQEESRKLDDRIKELSKQNTIAQELNDQREVIQKSISALKETHDKYTAVIRERLSDTATSAFQKMASEETRESLSKIVITDDFHLEVENKLGRPMLSQISSGQRQIASLSYICSLIEIAGNLEMPLLMDTPLGRLSGAHRDGCLHFIPTKTSQWIMLGTDTEIRDEEAEALRNSGHFGKVYEIEPVETLHSRIREAAVSSWVPTRTMLKVTSA